jgi:hypothetical protein
MQSLAAKECVSAGRCRYGAGPEINELTAAGIAASNGVVPRDSGVTASVASEMAMHRRGHQ